MPEHESAFASTLTYHWVRNGAGISKATGKTYTVTASDKGKKLLVKVCYKRTGYTTRCVTSATTSAIKVGTLTAPTPTITGTATAGQTLTVKPGTWTAGTTLTYQWLRNGKTLPGATGKTYKLWADDVDKRISVKVTGKKTGYTTTAKTSTPTRTVGMTTAQREAVEGVTSSLEEGVSEAWLRWEADAAVDFALDYLKPDWNEQALRYLNLFLLSKRYAMQDLMDDGFTTAQAEYAIAQTDFQQLALLSAQIEVDYLVEYGRPTSPVQVTSNLERDGFTAEEVTYAMENVSADWLAHATKYVENVLGGNQGYSKSKLSQIMEEKGYEAEFREAALNDPDIDWNQEAIEAGTNIWRQYDRFGFLLELSKLGFEPSEMEAAANHYFPA